MCVFVHPKGFLVAANPPTFQPPGQWMHPGQCCGMHDGTGGSRPRPCRAQKAQTVVNGAKHDKAMIKQTQLSNQLSQVHRQAKEALT